MIRVIGHRGASRDCPENTLIAFDTALERGADGLELDVQLSSDEVPIVYHDRTLTRAGGGRKRLAGMTARELRRLDPGARVDSRFRGQHLPTLRDVLKRYGRRTRLLIELKTREGAAAHARHLQLAREVVALVERMKLSQRVEILSFDARLLAECRRVAPSIRRVLNVRTDARSIDPQMRHDLRGTSAVSANIRFLTDELAAAVRRSRRELYAFTCNSPLRTRRALELGAGTIMSDRPGWLRSFLTGEGLL